MTQPGLAYRPYEDTDRAFFLRLVQDPERMRHMDGALALREAEALFASLLPGGARAHCAWVATLDGVRVAHSALVDTGGPESPEALFVVARTHEGRGHATRVAAALLERARSRGLPRVWATVDCEHAASRRVLEKAGFALVRWVEDELPPYAVYACDLPC